MIEEMCAIIKQLFCIYTGFIQNWITELVSAEIVKICGLLCSHCSLTCYRKLQYIIIL